MPADPSACMWWDVLGAVLLALFAFLGSRRGSLDGAFRLFLLLAAYAAAIFGGPRLAPTVSESLDLPGLLSLPLAGSALFVAVFVVGGLIGVGLRAWEKRTVSERSAGDRALGALLGAARGGVLVLLLSWAVMWMEAWSAVGSGPALPAVSGSVLTRLTGHVVESGVDAMLSGNPTAARMTRQMLSRPAETMAGLQGLLEDPSFVALTEDRLFLRYLEHGAIDSAMNRRSFVAIASDETIRTQLADLGLVGPDAAANGGVFREEARAVLEEVSLRIRGLSEDPEVQALARDPEVQQALQNGDALSLLRHPGFRALLARLEGQQPGTSL